MFLGKQNKKKRQLTSNIRICLTNETRSTTSEKWHTNVFGSL